MMEGFTAECAGLDVLPLGYVSESTLQWLYENCFGFLYPSLGEGFGLPVLEALSCGAAVITSPRTALPEVAGDAALYCNPDDPHALYSAMLRLDREPSVREVLRAAARPRAGLFSWSTAACHVLEVYQEVVRLPRRNSPVSA
jgi:glycosyltransferase involved in cell wall biosynthesis